MFKVFKEASMRTDARVAELILRAQNASDGGKGISCIGYGRKAQKDNHKAYLSKDSLIYEAVKTILYNKNKNCSFRFGVTRATTGYAPYIIYFSCQIKGGEKYQVSFHSYSRMWEQFIKTSHHVMWDRKDSRQAAITLYKYFCPNGLYVGSM